MPAASDLALVTMSGTTPECSMAQRVPVRPMPAWISSAMRTMPWSSQSWRSFCRNGAGAGRKPPSPNTGSMTTAATWEGSTVAMKARSRRPT
jgi:hypothetical protein